MPNKNNNKVKGDHKTSKLQATLKNMPAGEKENFKEEVAEELGINLNSDQKMSRQERGKLGGGMVKKMAQKLDGDK
jgi:hypothetical protein